MTVLSFILGDSGAVSLDDGRVIFSSESLLQEREISWALTLSVPGPEVVEFLRADWREKCFSGQISEEVHSATLSPFYTKCSSSSIGVFAWPIQRN